MTPYDLFAKTFLEKVTEYDFADMAAFERTSIVDGYMKR